VKQDGGEALPQSLFDPEKVVLPLPASSDALRLIRGLRAASSLPVQVEVARALVADGSREALDFVMSEVVAGRCVHALMLSLISLVTYSARAGLPFRRCRGRLILREALEQAVQVIPSELPLEWSGGLLVVGLEVE